MNTSDLLDDIQLELGMMQDSAGWNAQRPVVLRKLRTAASLLDEDFRDRLRFVPNVLLEGASLGNYDEPEALTAYTVPEDCDPQKIDSLSVQWSGLWHVVPQGISQTMRDNAYQASSTYLAWDVIECGQIEVWPHPTEFLPVRISYYRKPNDYTDDTGCVDMDPTLLNLMTLDQCAPIYARGDVDSINRKLNRHMGNVRYKQLHNQRFFSGKGPFRGGTPDSADVIYLYPNLNGIGQ